VKELPEPVPIRKTSLQTEVEAGALEGNSDLSRIRNRDEDAGDDCNAGVQEKLASKAITEKHERANC